MKDEKEVMKQVWEKELCNNPLVPAQWDWVQKFVRGSRSLVLTCTNSLWRLFSK